MGIQVDLLTQDKTQLQDYINFQFDGKYVSDFGLVVVTSGDRLSFDGSAEFEDEVSSVNGVNGQYYWGTNFKTLKREFTLATDGMTEAQVQAFKYHFRPGRYGRFVEPHLPFRESYCRVASVTNFTMIPFRKLVTTSYTTMDGQKEIVHTTQNYINEYKGEVKLTFEWDNPYSKSTIQYIEEEDLETYYPAIFTNNIPLSTSLAGKFLNLRSGILAIGVLGRMILGYDGMSVDCVLGKDDKALRYWKKSDSSIQRELVDLKSSDYKPYISPGLENNPNALKNIQELISGLTFYYNPSTAPSPAKITFDYKVTTNYNNSMTNSESWEPVYFNNIADEYNVNTFKDKKTNPNPNPYNTIENSDIILPEEIGNNGEYIFKEPEFNAINHKFFYTSPNVIKSINKAISIAYNLYKSKTALSGVQIEELLRQEILHDKVLKWTISVLGKMREDGKYIDKDDKLVSGATMNISIAPLIGSSQTISADWFMYFNLRMLYMFAMVDGGTWGNSFNDYSVTFDGKNCESIVKFKYNTYENKTLGTLDGEEKSGDMVYSPYLILGGGDTINNNGEIFSCHCLRFFKAGKAETDVSNITLEYDYLYL